MMPALVVDGEAAGWGSVASSRKPTTFFALRRSADVAGDPDQVRHGDCAGGINHPTYFLTSVLSFVLPSDLPPISSPRIMRLSPVLTRPAAQFVAW
jgi:hypothetical protein